MKHKVLVIDDEKNILQTFNLRLSKWGYDVFLAQDGATGLKILSEEECLIVITDLKMPGISGQDIIKKISEDYPNVEVVAITGYASVESAVEVMKYGAFDFLSKPLDFTSVQKVLEKISARITLKDENIRLKNRISDLNSEVVKKYKLNNLVGKSRSMLDIFDLIDRVAPLDSTVLIYGETGTGKELIAKAVHHNSSRSSGPMVTIDCGSLTETLLESELFGHKKGAFTGALSDKRGRFEQADGGTVFLDEISNASPSVQKKLLRLIQEKTFQRLGDERPISTDVRIITASNEDLMQMVKEGKFRRDLFYRLNVVPIHLPPLRNRKEDILLLTRHFVDLYAKRLEREPLEVAPEAIKQINAHPWPGNVRELSNVAERTVIMTPGNVIKHFLIVEDSQDEAPPAGINAVMLDPPLDKQIEELEYNYIKMALEQYNGRINNVVKVSGLSARTLFRKMKSYNLDKKDFQ